MLQHAMRHLRSLLGLLLIAGCATTMTDVNKTLNPIAERYVRLVLAVGEHDADYVDAYYGPPQWRQEVKAEKPSLETIESRARALRDELNALPKAADPTVALREEYLRRQTSALIARTEMLRGRKFTFDEEAQALYDVTPPAQTEEHFKRITEALERELPGEGTLISRLEAYRQGFVIPKEKLDAVFRTAVDACRSRTLEHIELPPSESFRIEYVTNKSWSGYNWYQGNFNSLIQVNTDLPIFIDRAIDLACHEGYPGHHVYNLLLEKHLVKDRGWPEYQVYPLFSPQSLIAEGSANYGIDVAFPANERVKYEKETLFPAAGLDPASADKYYRIQELVSRTSYAGNEAARRYLDGQWSADQAVDWLTKYALMAPARARQRLKFMEQYRSYVINYNLGKDLVKQYVEKRAGGDRNKRWEIFEELLSSPRLPSSLR
jgi:hypothetical protein